MESDDFKLGDVDRINREALTTRSRWSYGLFESPCEVKGPLSVIRCKVNVVFCDVLVKQLAEHLGVGMPYQDEV